MRLLLLLFFMLTIQVSPLSASSEVETLFYRGNTFYESEKYAEAIEAYEKIIALGKENWQVYFNLGNAYFRVKNVGRTVLNYERALSLNIDNEDIKHNLKLANLAVKDRILQPEKQAWVKIIEQIFGQLSVSIITWFALAFYVLFILSLAARYFSSAFDQKRILVLLRWASGCILLLSICILCTKWYVTGNAKFGIVIAPKIIATSAPQDNAQDVFSIHEGTKFKLEQKNADWVRIRLRDGKTGWVRAETIGII